MKLVIQLDDSWADDVCDACLLPDGLHLLLGAIGDDITDRDHPLEERSTVVESLVGGSERVMATYWLEPERPTDRTERPTDRICVELPGEQRRGYVTDVIVNPHGDGRDLWTVQPDDGDDERTFWADDCHVVIHR